MGINISCYKLADLSQKSDSSRLESEIALSKLLKGNSWKNDLARNICVFVFQVFEDGEVLTCIWGSLAKSICRQNHPSSLLYINDFAFCRCRAVLRHLVEYKNSLLHCFSPYQEVSHLVLYGGCFSLSRVRGELKIIPI